MSPTVRARRERKFLAIAMVVVTIVGGVVAGVIWHNVDRVDTTSKGLVKASCVLVRVIEQGAQTQARSANTGKELLAKLPSDSPERPARVKARQAALKQEQQLLKLAAEMRSGITCPQRPAGT